MTHTQHYWFLFCQCVCWASSTTIDYCLQILFRYATAFFKCSEEGILRCTDYISANQYLREMGPRMSDTEKITYVAFNSVNPFPMRMISAKRAMYLEQVKVGLT